MKEFLKKNFVLLLAFLLPVVFIAVVALGAYISSRSVVTDYHFVYATCMDGRNYYQYPCDTYLQKRYTVANNTLVVNSVDMTLDSDKNGLPDFNAKYIDRLFLYNTKKHESREITLSEAQTMRLNGLLTSPDGVTVSSYYDRNGGDFFFIFGGGSSSYGHYLTKGKSRSKINLINSSDEYYYQNNFQFVGWVLP